MFADIERIQTLMIWPGDLSGRDEIDGSQLDWDALEAERLEEMEVLDVEWEREQRELEEL